MESLKVISSERFLMIREINWIVTCNTNWKTDVKCFIQVDSNYVQINP